MWHPANTSGSHPFQVISLEQILLISQCLPALCHPVCGPGQAQRAKGGKASSHIAWAWLSRILQWLFFPSDLTLQLWWSVDYYAVSLLAFLHPLRQALPAAKGRQGREESNRLGTYSRETEIPGLWDCFAHHFASDREVGAAVQRGSDRCGCHTPCSDRHSRGKPAGSPCCHTTWPFPHVKRKSQGKQPGETFSE